METTRDDVLLLLQLLAIENKQRNKNQEVSMVTTPGPINPS